MQEKLMSRLATGSDFRERQPKEPCRSFRFFSLFPFNISFMGDLAGQGTLLLWDRVRCPCGVVLGEPGDHYSSRTVILKMSDLKKE